LLPLRTRNAHPTVFFDLATYRPWRPLLPNLRSLRCTRSTGIPPAIQGFIGPQLRRVNINCTETPENDTQQVIIPLDLDNLVSSLSRLSPNIRFIRFKFEDPTPALPAFFDMLGNLHYLRTLHTSELEVPPLVLNQLAKLPSLEGLYTISLSPSNVHLLNTDNGRFTRLETFAFDFDGVPMSSIITMLDVMRCRFSGVSCVSMRVSRDPSEIRSLVASLLRHPCRQSLKRLKLGVRYIPPGPSPLIPIETFRPLLSFNLTTLSIGPIAIDDSWITEIAQAWPNLESFSVTDLLTAKPKITLEGMILLVKRCPRLRTLTMTIHAQPVRPTLLTGVSNDHITSIWLDYSSVIQPIKVFLSLVRMFPNLIVVQLRSQNIFIQGRSVFNTEKAGRK
jgi:hypothetical protein